MNQTHIHLVITHLPIFGSLLGSLVLAYGLWYKSTHTVMAAYWVFVLSAIGAGIAYFTGEAAEESVEDFPGVIESVIKTHEDFALYALISLLFLGAASIIGLLITWKKSRLTNNTAFMILLISIISFGMVSRTAYLGGQIRHPEASAITGPYQQESQGEEDND